MMRRHGKLWLLDPSQWWRCRHRQLWRGRGFDPHDSRQVTSYAVDVTPISHPAITRVLG